MMSPADIGASVNESNEFMPNVPIPDRAHLTLFCARLKNGFANLSAHTLAMYTPFLIVVTLAYSTTVPGRRPASLFFKPLRRADPLRRDAQAVPGAVATGCSRSALSAASPVATAPGTIPLRVPMAPGSI